MPAYAVGKEDEPVLQVITYSAPPGPVVLDAWAAKGYRLVRLTGGRAAARARAISQDPGAWRIRGEGVERWR